VNTAAGPRSVGNGQLDLRGRAKLVSLIRSNGVIPIRKYCAAGKAYVGDFFLVGFDTGWIVGSIQIGIHEQTSLCFGAADELQHCFVTHQRLSRPVLADFGEQSMFNRIPFEGPAGIVRHCHGQGESVR
jgi:hypothetical protein